MSQSIILLGFQQVPLLGIHKACVGEHCAKNNAMIRIAKIKEPIERNARTQVRHRHGA